jgi:polar amino acid transport system substrate-binding protein
MSNRGSISFTKLGGRLAVGVAALLMLVACGGSPTPAASTSSSGAIPLAKEDMLLHNALPASNLSSGQLIFDTIPNSPWAIVGPDGKVDSGVDIDLGNQLVAVLGLKLNTVLVGDAATLLGGISAGRYDVFLGPLAITAARKQILYELVWVTNTFYFEVQKSSTIKTVSDLCGKNMAVLTGTISVGVVTGVSKSDCVANGKQAITQTSFATDPEAQLSVQSGRTDAYALSSASCAFAVSQPGGKTLRCVVPGANDNVAFNPAAMAIAKSNDQLLTTLQGALEDLHKDGIYQKVMAKWGLTDSVVYPFVLG